jgi:hypothetical protein
MKKKLRSKSRETIPLRMYGCHIHAGELLNCLFTRTLCGDRQKLKKSLIFFNTTVSFILQLQCIFTIGRQYVNFSYTRIIEIFGIQELLFLLLGM